MKKLISIITLAFIALGSNLFAAEQNSDSIAEKASVLVVNLTDGTNERFKIKDTPEVTMADHQIVVKSSTLESTYAFGQVSHFSFEEDKGDVGVEDIKGSDTSFAFSFVDNSTITISATGLKWVAVYNLTGTKLMTETTDTDTVILDISNLSPGAYIIAPSCHSAIKIIKR